MKIRNRSLPVVVSAAVLLSSVVPVYGMEEKVEKSSAKEEVIYVTLNTDGSVKNGYVVNSFEGGEIVDYGNYASVKMMNTNDTIHQEGDKISFSASAPKVYYEGILDEVEIPWNVSLRYFLDGKEYSADEIAGKSGKLEIQLKITKNEQCKGEFFEDYALQTLVTLDTKKCSNIIADDATIANVGSNKQLTYTIFPGKGIETVISADVEDFEMSAISINGIRLNLNIEIEDEELKDKVNDLIDAAVELDDGALELNDGAGELKDGSADLKDGASSLRDGAMELKGGMEDLESGVETVQEGLDTLNEKSSTLVDGSGEVKTALLTIQKELNGISVTSESLGELTKSSGQIKQAISDLYDGASALQTNVGYAQYKSIMAENGLDIDTMVAGNDQAITALNNQIYELQLSLDQIAGVEGYEDQVAYLQSQIYQLQQIVNLLYGSSAAIGGMESYLTEVNTKMATLEEGLKTLKTSYGSFDTAISQLVTTLNGMLGKMTELKTAIDTLTESYTSLDTGIGEYTDGVAKIVAGYSQITEGVTALAKGSRDLADGSNDLYDGTAELFDGAFALCEGTQEMADGTGELRRETSGMDTEVDDEIDKILDSITGEGKEIVSFVSEKNTDVEAVQFAIQTDPIKKEETEATAAEATAEEAEEEQLTFWQKLAQLFDK